MERRLTAILAADVVGYSRLMGKDEAGTFNALKSMRDELFSPKVTKHHGRIVKLMGDGTLVEFASVVDAVNCAVNIQQAMSRRNVIATIDHDIKLRIGINVGDVIVHGEDLYGDGVNIAARLESVAEPGGICLSQQAYDQIESKLDLTFECLGQLKLKNIDRPVRAFRLVCQGKERITPSVSYWRGKNFLDSPRQFLSIALLMAGMFVGGYHPWRVTTEPPNVARSALHQPKSTFVAEMPLNTGSSDSRQSSFRDPANEFWTRTPQVLLDLSVDQRLNSSPRTTWEAAKYVVHDNPVVFQMLEGQLYRAREIKQIYAALVETMKRNEPWVTGHRCAIDEGLTSQDLTMHTMTPAMAMSDLEFATIPNTEEGARFGSMRDAHWPSPASSWIEMSNGAKMTIMNAVRALDGSDSDHRSGQRRGLQFDVQAKEPSRDPETALSQLGQSDQVGKRNVARTAFAYAHLHRIRSAANPGATTHRRRFQKLRQLWSAMAINRYCDNAMRLILSGPGSAKDLVPCLR